MRPLRTQGAHNIRTRGSLPHERSNIRTWLSIAYHQFSACRSGGVHIQIYGCICSEACFTCESPLTAWAGPYMYPTTADNYFAPKTGYNAPISLRFGGGKTMVSPLVYYQLALLALIWLFVMLHLGWPRRSATPPPTPGTPIKPKREPSPEPKAFEGLTHKPHCALCERETGETPPAPPPRPAPMPPTHRRPPYRGHLDALLSPHRV